MHLDPGSLTEVRRILAFYAEGYPVYAFGSRVHGRLLKPNSDLDLCIRGKQPMPTSQLGRLSEAFAISPLLFRVDIADWHYMGEDFQHLIEPDLVLVQAGHAGSQSGRVTVSANRP